MRAPVHRRSVRLLAALGVTAALLMPTAALPARAAKFRSSSASDDPGPRCAQPVPDAAGQRLRGLPAHLNLLVDFGPNLEPGPRLRRLVDARRRREVLDLPHSDGHDVVRRPASDLRRCLLLLGPRRRAIKDGANIGAGYLDPSLKDAGVTKVVCPDAQTMIASTTDPSDRVLQVYLPIIPQHIWGKETYKTIGGRQVRRAARGHRPVTRPAEWKTSPVRAPRAEPQLLGQAGRRGRGRDPVLQGRRHDGPGAQGRRDRLCPGHDAGAAQGAPRKPAQHQDRRRQLQRLVAAGVQRVTGPRRAPSRPGSGLRRRRSGSRVPPTRWLRHRQEGAGRSHPGRLWRGRHDDRAAGSSAPGTWSPTIHGPSTSRLPSRSSTPPVTSWTRMATASTRKESPSASGWTTRTRRTRTRRPAQFVKDWYGQLGSR